MAEEFYREVLGRLTERKGALEKRLEGQKVVLERTWDHLEIQNENVTWLFGNEIRKVTSQFY
ncbi:MAG: hypothetical protein QXG77_03475 [Nitrososphaerota archaeon]